MERLNKILTHHTVQSDDTWNKLLGAAFVVCNEDGVLYSGSAGRCGFSKTSKSFNIDTSTWIASMTKIITTTCLMQLVERGSIGLDDDVRGRVPELDKMQILRGFTEQGCPILQDNVKPITLRMLLTHTVGIAADFLDPPTMRWSNSIGRTARHLDWSRDGLNTPLRFPPGDSWLYGSGVDWAALVLENITGLTLGQYMQVNIFDTLKMKDSGFWPGKLTHTASRQAAWSIRTAAGTLEPGLPLTPEEHELEAGGTGLYSTATDFAHFLLGLAQGKLVAQTTLNEMFTPQLTLRQKATLNKHSYHPIVRNTFTPEFPDGLEVDFGIGGIINVVDVVGKRRAGSMAWSGIANSRWWIDRKSGIAAVLVVNILPHGDTVVAQLYKELEAAVYSSLPALRKEQQGRPHARI